MVVNMKHTTFKVTTGRYRGIGFKINHPHDGYKHAYYVYLRLSQIKNQSISDSIMSIPQTKYGWDYSSNGYINSIPMHCGCTFFEKNVSGSASRIEIGCDYNHLWDEDNGVPELEDILEEIKETINYIHESFGYLLFCSGGGGYFEEKDGSYSGENFYSNQYRDAKKEEVASK